MVSGPRLVIGTVGMPGSGKSTVAKVAEEMGVTVVSGGDIIRKRVEEQGLPLTDKSSAMVTNELRREHGDAAIATECINVIQEQSYTEILVDSFRTIEEVHRFRQVFRDEFYLLRIIADFETRASRLLKRERSDDIESVDELRNRDQREIEWGIEEVMDEADLTIENNASYGEFKNQIQSLIRQMRK